MWVIVIQEYVLEYWAYRLLFAAGLLGQATKASRCTLPVGPFLLHLFLIQVLHDFALSRFQRGGNSRLNVNKISFPLEQHSQLLLPRSGSKSAGAACAAWCWKQRCQPWFCHCLAGGLRRAARLSVAIWMAICNHQHSETNIFHVETLVCAPSLIHFAVICACIAARMCFVSPVSPLSRCPSLLWSWSLPTQALVPSAPSAIKKLNIADLLLFQNIFHLPKYTGPAFLTLRSDLCIWSGNAVKGEAVALNMAGFKAR